LNSHSSFGLADFKFDSDETAYSRKPMIPGLDSEELRFAVDCQPRQQIPKRGITRSTTREQAKEFLAVPDRSSLKGKRDYAILALLVGCALRRHELANHI
jgi:integrase